MKSSTKISASIFGCNIANLGAEILSVEQAGVDMLHCDIMDGSFVPAIALGAHVVEAAKRCSSLMLDVHMMVVEPERHVASLADAGANIITFHPEACLHPHRLLGEIRSMGIQSGIVLNPGTSISHIEELLPLCDIVLVMSVNPGVGGQKFLPETVDKIRRLRQLKTSKNMEYSIEVDGGINLETAKSALAAGADVLVVGTALFSANNKISFVQEICKKI